MEEHGVYQSLRKEIPNGLVSVDGSELIVWLDGEPYKFNLELSVDVKTFNHTGFSVGDTENSDEVIKVLEAHRKDWGNPLGVLCDSGKWNLSEQVRSYLQVNDIELVPAGPSNPKGNGTDGFQPNETGFRNDQTGSVIAQIPCQERIGKADFPVYHHAKQNEC